MYKVLYRKYRPRRFADVVGQPQVTVTLQNELKSHRISHAYLFTGTRGTGKTTCAKILAKAVNCLSPIDGDACGVCEVCTAADEGSFLDILEIDAASNNGVDSIRRLIEEANFTPNQAKYRVYIIDEVHMLSVPAFNALLKTLEEPPAHVIFILATTEVHRLLPTILSRCQRFDFRRISPEDVAARLSYIAEAEAAVLAPEAAHLIARITDGTMRDAVSILDQCISRSTTVTQSIVTQTAGIANQSYLAALTDAVLAKDASAALSIIDRLYQNAKDIAKLCEEMVSYFRGLMLLKTMRKPETVLQYAPKELSEMKEQAQVLSLPTLLHGLQVFQDAQGRMHFADMRIEMETAFVRLCQPELDNSAEAILRRLEALEKAKPLPLLRPLPSPENPNPPSAQASAEPAAPSGNPPFEETASPGGGDVGGVPPSCRGQAAVSAAIPSPPPLAQGQSPGLPVPANAESSRKPGAQSILTLSKEAQPLPLWPEILARLQWASTSAAAAFRGSTAYINGDYLLIDAPELAFTLLRESSQRQQIRAQIAEITGTHYKLGPYKRSDHPQGEGVDPLDLLEQRARAAGIPVTELS